MKDVGLQILYIMVSTITPIIAGFLAALIKQKISEIAKRTENAKLERYINTVTSVLTDAVLEVEQTYVDQLKKDGEFTEESQKIAKAKALEIAERLITQDGKAAVEQVYGDFEAYALTKIEALVKRNKEYIL